MATKKGHFDVGKWAILSTNPPWHVPFYLLQILKLEKCKDPELLYSGYGLPELLYWTHPDTLWREAAKHEAVL